MRYAIRTLLKSPGFSLVAIATIALGIAANTAIFSVVNGVLLRALPFPDESRIVMVTTSTTDERESNHSAGDFLLLQRSNAALAVMAGYRSEVSAVAVAAGEPAQVHPAWVPAEASAV